MGLRSLAVGLTVVSLAAFQAREPASFALETAVTPSPASAILITSPAETALVAVWQAANPGVAPPGLPQIVAAFDPDLQSIAGARPEDAHAFIVATTAFAAALQPVSPTACVALPRARFTSDTLAAVPAAAIPAFRTMLTTRLAAIAAGKARTDRILPAFSGSMQTLSNDLTIRNATAFDTLALVGSNASYDPVAACQATIDGWRTLETTPQAQLLIDMLYSTGLYGTGDDAPG